ncbi:hypothetical protein [Desulfitibacter alkalitolerans]|uniref:hypothetical protein n=1 Tax=Desulfitibacter alkalitolerans TaxID=264641 RepID=UPI0012EBA2E9|nr:hypothetical protein [Desulfitibacter alkalitolerans]
MEVTKAKIDEIMEQMELLSSELAFIKETCIHEKIRRDEDYAYCDICGEKLGWWGLYMC